MPNDEEPDNSFIMLGLLIVMLAILIVLLMIDNPLLPHKKEADKWTERKGE